MPNATPARPSATRAERLRGGCVVLGLISGVVLTLGWWAVIAIGLYHTIG